MSVNFRHPSKSGARASWRHAFACLPALVVALGVLTLPVAAGELLGGAVGGLGGAVGGAAGGVGGAVGGAAGGVGGAVGGAVGGVGGVGGAVGGISGSAGGIGGSIGTTASNITGGNVTSGLTAKVTVLGPQDLVKAKARSSLLLKINARLHVLTKKNLVKVCLGVGGGSGCGTGDRHKLLGLIETRLALLTHKSLANLCVSIGGSGCGRIASSSGGGGNGGGGNGGAGTGGGSDDAGGAFDRLSASDRRLVALNCRKVLTRPGSYESDLVAICKLLRL